MHTVISNSMWWCVALFFCVCKIFLGPIWDPILKDAVRSLQICFGGGGGLGIILGLYFFGGGSILLFAYSNSEIYVYFSATKMIKKVLILFGDFKFF